MTKYIIKLVQENDKVWYITAIGPLYTHGSNKVDDALLFSSKEDAEKTYYHCKDIGSFKTLKCKGHYIVPINVKYEEDINYQDR